MLSILTCYKLEKGTIETALSKKAKTRRTQEDKRRMHTSRSAMCGVQNSYIFAHSPYSKSTSTETSLYVCGSSGIRSYGARRVTELPSSFQSARNTSLQEYLHGHLPAPPPPISSPTPKIPAFRILVHELWESSLSPKEKMESG